MDKQPCSISNITSHHKLMPWMTPVPSSPLTTSLSTKPNIHFSDMHLHNTNLTLYQEAYYQEVPIWQGGRQAESTSADFWGVEGDEKGGRGLYTNSWMRWQLWMMPIWLEPYWSQNGCVYAGPEGSEWWKDNCKKTINYRIKFPHRILPGTWQTNFHISVRFLLGWERIKVNETT